MPKHFYITKTKCDENVENYRCVLFSSGDCQKHLSKFISLNYFPSKCSTWRELNSILTSCTSFDGWIWSMVNPIWEVVCWYCGTHLYSSIYSSKITMDGGWSHDIKRHLLLERKAITNPDSIDITLLTKVCLVKAMALPVVMYGYESWTIKKTECQRIGAFELWCWTRLLRVPWTTRSDPVNPKGNQPWISIGRVYTEAEAPILWQPDAKSQLIGKDSDAGKNWGQVEKRTTQDEVVGWHHWLNRHEFEQAPGDSKGQGSLVCCSPWS